MAATISEQVLPDGTFELVINLHASGQSASNTMKSHLIHLVLSVLTVLATNAATPAPAAEAPGLDSHLEPLRPVLEKTWKGTFKNSKPDQPTVDVSHWERALNGRAVRILHSINDGVYGGESIVMWDNKKQEISYHYFTTAGFSTTGTMRFDQGKFITHEVVTGSAEGVTEVRGTSELLSDGTLHVQSEYLKNGSWVPGHEVNYKQDPTATVVFR